MKNIYRPTSSSVESKTQTAPTTLYSDLRADFHHELPLIMDAKLSRYDGTVKFALGMTDGSKIETVIMPEKDRITVCVSSQVGCSQGCVFCHTGRMGLSRNLNSGEIVGQVLVATRWMQDNQDWLESLPSGKGAIRLPRVDNIVFMGMGEPCDNVSEVVKAIEILSDPWATGIGTSKITVSTAGHLDGFQELYARLPNINYALSLHSVDQTERARLMPITKRFPLSQLLDCFKYFSKRDGKTFLIQYTVISGVNDCSNSARRLVQAIEGLKCKVNLIPLNPIDPSRLLSPDQASIQAFRDILHESGIRVMVRYSKGQDIDAACGQLISKDT